MIITMTTLFLALILAGLAAVLVAEQSRAAKIKRYAARNRCAYDKRKDSLTTEQTAGRLEFFKDYFHLFFNVMTFSDQLAFMRLADDKIYTDDKPGTKPVFVSVFTAEFRSRTFPALKIAGRQSVFKTSQYTLVKTNISPVDSCYVIHAPSQASGVLLTAFIINLLKRRQDVYLEVNDNALVYHENKLFSTDEYPQFHFRAMQVLAEFENILIHLDNPAGTTAVLHTSQPAAQGGSSDAEKQAEMLLRAAAGPGAQQNATGGWRTMGAVIVLALLILAPMAAWLLIRNLLK